MPRIKLAHWLGSRRPGDEIDVSDGEAAALARDGRVAEVVAPPAALMPEPAREAPAEPEPVVTGRKRR
jgi:hypothetical protein